MRVLVTGASGFLGAHVVPDLLARGTEVVGATRREGALGARAAEWVPSGELFSVEGARRAMKGCDVVIHLAAHAHQMEVPGAHDPRAYDAVNVVWPTVLLEAAHAVGVAQFIFISSVGAVCSSSEQTIDEKTEPRPVGLYGTSKLRAERELEKLAPHGPTALTIIRPCLMYGRGNPGNMGRLVTLVSRRIPLPFGKISNRRSFAYVGSVVAMIRMAILNPNAYGEKFMAADDEIVSTPEMCRAIGDAIGRRVRLVDAPLGILRLAGRIGDLAAAATGRPVGIDSYGIDRLMSSLPCANGKAKLLLEWTPALGFTDAVRASFRSEGRTQQPRPDENHEAAC